jgi:hypothetical protein
LAIFARRFVYMDLLKALPPVKGFGGIGAAVLKMRRDLASKSRRTVDKKATQGE